MTKHIYFTPWNTYNKQNAAECNNNSCETDALQLRVYRVT